MQRFTRICDTLDRKQPPTADTDDAVSEALQQLLPHIVNGVQLELCARADVPLFSGSSTVDALLFGGLRRGEVVEVSGPPAVGKTQLWCVSQPVVGRATSHNFSRHSLSAAACAAVGGHAVLYLDTTCGFSAIRLSEILKEWAVRGDVSRVALSRICVATAFDVHELLSLLDGVLRGDGEGGQQLAPALVVVDSVTAVVSPLLNTKHAQGHALMVSLMYALRAVAEERGCAVLVTNATVSGREGGEGSLKPALGETWKSAPHTRLQCMLGWGDGAPNTATVELGRGRGERRAYKLRASGWHHVAT